MRLIKPSFVILDQDPGILGMKRQIEIAGRTCYKSEGKIEDGSEERFVHTMETSGHGAMLEHGSVYQDFSIFRILRWGFYLFNKYSKVRFHGFHVYVSTNYRVVFENGRLDDMRFFCEPTRYHEKRYCVRFTCDRGVSHEFVRHRVMSHAQESTRYCNYSKDKFGNELTYICPPWVDYGKALEFVKLANRDNKVLYALGHDDSEDNEKRALASFIFDLSNAEHGYIFQVSMGWKAQEARDLLPNAIKTELVMTGFSSDWRHFFKLRDDKAHAHPQAYELAHPLHEEFDFRGYLK